MEWTGEQQILFLLQSAILGFAQGLAMDFIVGFAPVSNHKTFLWVDIVFGPASAVVTLCGALLIMDGQLHPILLFGIFLGMAISHFSIGRFLCGAVRKMRISARRGARCIGTFLC